MLMGLMEACRYHTVAATSLQRRAPATWCWLHRVPDDGKRQHQASLSCNGCRGRSLRCTIALYRMQFIKEMGRHGAIISANSLFMNTLYGISLTRTVV